MAFEVEWETFVSPLLLLAGAEALYGQLEHVMSDPKAHHAPPADLSTLYRTIHKDLAKVKRELCENILIHPEGRTAKVLEAARNVQVSLEALQKLTTVRCRLIEFQRKLFARESGADESPPLFWEKCVALSQSCREFLPDPEDPCGLTVAVIEALSSEVKAWIYLLDTMACLEQCRFLETIVAANKTKECIPLSSLTTLQRWFRQTMERILCIMPMYFDVVMTFATPFYGFDRISLETSAQEEKGRIGLAEDYDETVLEFLREQGKGAPAMAFAIVVDAVQTSNQHMERGITLNSIVPDSSDTQWEQLLRNEWKAVFMRSTLHSTAGTSPKLSRSPSNTSSRLFGLRKSSSKSSQNMISEEEHLDASPGGSRKVRSIEAGITLSPYASHDRHCMEYAPETGSFSWPHTEWHRIVEIILNIDEQILPSSPARNDGLERKSEPLFGKALTYRPAESPKDVRVAYSPSPSGWMGNWGVPPPPPPLLSGPMHSNLSSSNIHMIRLGQFVWMMVIVREEEEGKWQLRRSRGHTDEEIRAFLDSLALKLRVSGLLSTHKISEARVMPKGKVASTGYDLLSLWKGGRHENLDDSNNAKEFLRSLKESFGLKPQSPLIDNPYSGLFGAGSSRSASTRSPARRSRQRRKRRALDHEDSAIAFFLGENLIRSIRK